MSLAKTSAIRYFSIALLMLAGFSARAQSLSALESLASETRSMMTLPQQSLYEQLAAQDPAEVVGVSLCWQEDTDRLVVQAFEKLLPAEHLKYSSITRWTETATDGPVPALGTPITLTWSIVPDGTTTAGYFEPDHGPSDLIANFDTLIPGWRDRIQQSFDAWAAVSGVRYVYEPNDDGVPMHNDNKGVLGVRGDIRIGGAYLDGPSGLLAFNPYPEHGDMVIDTAQTDWYGHIGDYLLLRNLISHEAGHGLGLTHVASQAYNLLMEPIIMVTFDGPQLDDILGANRSYGDRDEFPTRNDAVGNATMLSAPNSAGYVTQSGRSIDDLSDVDVFAFEVPTDNPPLLSVIVRPTGTVYSWASSSGSPEVLFDPRLVHDLELELLAVDGVEVLSQSSVNGFGGSETIWPGILADGPGVYYLRVRSAASGQTLGSEVQQYELELRFGLTLAQLDCDANGASDLQEISSSPSLDCNNNAVLDACEVQGFSVYADHPLGHYSYGVSTDGNRAYVTGEAEDIVYAYDISDPLAPTEVGMASVTGLALYSVPVDDYLYVSSYSDGLYVLDKSGLEPPPSNSEMPMVGHLTAPTNILRFVAAGDYLYLPAEVNGFHVASIADRANPVLVGSLTTSANVRGVVVSGNYAFAAASLEGLYVIDVTDPTVPSLVSQVDTPDKALGIAQLGENHVIVADLSSLQVIDVSAPTSPAVVGTVPGLVNARNVMVEGNIAYAGTASGLIAYDMSNPALPVFLAQVSTTADVYQTALATNNLVSACSSYGLVVTSSLSLDVNGDGVPDECQSLSDIPLGVERLSHRLHQAVPNPFNPSSQIAFDLSAAAQVNLSIYDISGRLVKELLNENMAMGNHRVAWHGKDHQGNSAASGVYFYKLVAGSFTATKRMVLLK